jgi:HD-GYP domain-containing protein (c-di-GMP phosphodiesterase class II)
MKNLSSSPDDTKVKKYSLDEIQAGCFFSKNVYLDTNFVLTAPEMPFDSTLKETLKTWGVSEVLSAGEIHADYAGDKDAAESNVPVVHDLEEIKKANLFYNTFQQYTEKLFFQGTALNMLNYESVATRMVPVCNTVKKDYRYLLRLNKNTVFYQQHNQQKNYLCSHAVNSTIISLIIGLQLKFPKHKLIELGVAALLHEIGMIQLPLKIYFTDGPMGNTEWKAMQTHPLLGFNILKAQDFPLNIRLAALEHHERENGKGYPRKLRGDEISLYGKIIAVACSYEAISSQRPHKKPKDGHTALLELLKNEGKQYNDTVIRALVSSLSLYPIGLYVLLSNGKKGQVINECPEALRYPIVQVLGAKTSDVKNKIIQTSHDGISIVRPLSKEEVGTIETAHHGKK